MKTLPDSAELKHLDQVSAELINVIIDDLRNELRELKEESESGELTVELCSLRLLTKALRPLPENHGAMPELERFGALLVGPGWGTDPGRQGLLQHLLRQGLPGVLDADAITLLRAGRGARLGGRWVLTPHPGEMARLLGTEASSLLADPLPPLLAASRELGAVIALKGHCTLVASPQGRYAVLDGMNPALGTAGSGDVLAGIVAGLVAGGLSAWEAARQGVALHAAIGERLFRERGFFLAEDMVEAVSAAVAGGGK